MCIIKKLSFLLTAILVVVGSFAVNPSVSLANQNGQCDGPSSRFASTPTVWLHNLEGEGVAGQTGAIEKRVGFVSRDTTFKDWVKSRTIVAPLAQPAYVADYYCRDKQARLWKYEYLPAGRKVVFVLPRNLARAAVSPRPKKGYRRQMVKNKVAGQSTCSNPTPGNAIVFLYVRTHKRHKPRRHHVQHKKVVKVEKPSSPPLSCSPGHTLINGACQTVNVSAQQECEHKGGNWNSSENLCSVIVVVGNCSYITVTDGSGNTVSTGAAEVCPVTVVTPPEKGCGCKPPVETPSIVITSRPSENMIPAGVNSGELHLTVEASTKGGTVTIDPGIGSVSKCGGSPQGSVTFSSLGSGASTLCFVLFAPEDGDKPSSMTVTYTATLAGAAPCVKEDTLEIQYQPRP